MEQVTRCAMCDVRLKMGDDDAVLAWFVTSSLSQSRLTFLAQERDIFLGGVIVRAARHERERIWLFSTRRYDNSTSSACSRLMFKNTMTMKPDDPNVKVTGIVDTTSGHATT